MRICPYCGYYNPDSFTRCSDCKQPLITYDNRSASRQWRICPDCGYNNVEDAETCLRCGYRLVEPVDMPEDAPEPAAPLQLSAAQAPDAGRKGCQYLLGLGLGFIPLLLILLGLGFAVGGTGSATSNLFGTLGSIGLFLYLAAIIVTIVCLFIREVRFVGYGLLTAVLVSPVAAAVGCVVLINLTFGGPRGGQ